MAQVSAAMDAPNTFVPSASMYIRPDIVYAAGFGDLLYCLMFFTCSKSCVREMSAELNSLGNMLSGVVYPQLLKSI